MPVLASDHDGGSRAAVAAAAFVEAAEFEPMLRLAPEAHFLRLAGRPVLFSRGAEAVFELHGDAARAAELLSFGTSASALVDLMVRSGWTGPEAEAIAADLLTDWSRRDLLVMDAAPPMNSSVTYEIAETRLRVSSTGDRTLVHAGQMFRRAPGKDHELVPTYNLSRLLGRIAIRCPSGRMVIVRDEEAAPELKSAVIADLLRSSKSVALHAACLVAKGEAILLTGPPGAGKSTLAAGLANAGFCYAGDDITLVRDSEAVGICVALTLKEGASSLLRAKENDQEHLPFRRRDGVRLAYEWPPAMAPSRSFPIAAIVRLDRTGSGEASLATSDPLAAMRELLAEAYSAKGSASLAELKMLDRIVDRARLLEIRYSNLADAVALLSAEFL